MKKRLTLSFWVPATFPKVAQRGCWNMGYLLTFRKEELLKEEQSSIVILGQKVNQCFFSNSSQSEVLHYSIQNAKAVGAGADRCVHVTQKD